ncbi:MAG: hypothetical protein ABIZ70_04600 [Gemmatimonadales bacterium]
MLLDDRGLTYLKHGEPQQRAQYSAVAARYVESWLYVLRDTTIVVHFRHPESPEVLSGMVTTPVAALDWMSACQLAPKYCVLEARQGQRGGIPREQVVRLKELSELDQRYLRRTDDAPQRFDFKLPMAAAAIGLGKAPGVTTVVADVSLRDLVAHATDDSTRLALRWQLRIRNAAKEWVVSLDTIRRYRLPANAKSAAADAYLTLMLEVPVPAGTNEVKLVLSDTTGKIGAEYTRTGLVVESPTAAAGLSDLVLLPDGGQGAASSIEGTPVRLSPSLTPGRAKFIGIGYIITGAAGKEVAVSVTVTEIGKEKDPPAIQVTFPDRPPTARTFRTQRVGISALKKGVYTLQISAEVVPGTRLVRSQLLAVR